MKSSSIRFIVILAILCIVGITITQLYWVRRAFDLKEAEFDRTVNAALFNVANQIFDINKTPSPAMNPVRQVSTNYFIVMVNGEVDAGLLEYLLKSEFEKRNIRHDFEYGVYDCSNEKMRYGDYISLQSARKSYKQKLPTWNHYAYYFGVQFPNREAHLINQMGIWSFSSFVLLVVIVFFGYTLFVILKQKRLSEIQKRFHQQHDTRIQNTDFNNRSVNEVLKDPNIIHQPERLLNYTTIIEKENTRLRQQVERVLQMAKLEKEDIGLKKELVDIHQVIQDAIKNTSGALHERNGSVRCELTSTRSSIEADKLHLTNVVYNLIDNAIKYCKTSPHIIIRTKDVEKSLLLEIQDNGIGISPENQKRVFQKFFRVPTGNVHDVKGFGIGLNYVKTIIEAHKGNVRLVSNLGEGCIFKISLPFE